MNPGPVCANPACNIPLDLVDKHAHGRCGPCYTYLGRHGNERPERLVLNPRNNGNRGKTRMTPMTQVKAENPHLAAFYRTIHAAGQKHTRQGANA